MILPGMILNPVPFYQKLAALKAKLHYLSITYEECSPIKIKVPRSEAG